MNYIHIPTPLKNRDAANETLCGYCFDDEDEETTKDILKILGDHGPAGDNMMCYECVDSLVSLMTEEYGL